MACTQPDLVKGAVPSVIPINISGDGKYKAYKNNGHLPKQ